MLACLPAWRYVFLAARWRVEFCQTCLLGLSTFDGSLCSNHKCSTRFELESRREE